jgi:LemA protein
MPYLIAIAVLLILIPIIIYNTLIAKKNMVLNVFATIDALLKKRFDLVPNLVATVKGYAKHEKDLLNEITQARAKAFEGQMSPDQQIQADSTLTQLLTGLFATVENYPDLKANQNFMNLQRNLTELEEQISAARRAYNAAVNDYNNAVEMFPTNIIASMMNYQRKNYFQIPQKERINPNAKELLNQ